MIQFIAGLVCGLVTFWCGYRIGYQDGHSAMEQKARNYAPNKEV